MLIYMKENTGSFLPCLTLTNLHKIMSRNLIGYGKLPGKDICYCLQTAKNMFCSFSTNNIMFCGNKGRELFSTPAKTRSVMAFCKHLSQAIGNQQKES